MHGDLTVSDARIAALNASVAFTAATRREEADRTLDEGEPDAVFTTLLATAERFEQWLTRLEPDPTLDAL